MRKLLCNLCYCVRKYCVQFHKLLFPSVRKCKLRNHCCHDSDSGTVVFQSEENGMLELIKKLLFHVPGTVAFQGGDNVMLQVKEILF